MHFFLALPECAVKKRILRRIQMAFETSFLLLQQLRSLFCPCGFCKKRKRRIKTKCAFRLKKARLGYLPQYLVYLAQALG